MDEVFHPGRDNEFILQLKVDKKDGLGSQPLTIEQMQAITRIILVFRDQTIDSDINPEAFDWVTREDEAVVIFYLGGFTIPAGIDLAADLFIYDADHTNGIYWGSFSLKSDPI